MEYRRRSLAEWDQNEKLMRQGAPKMTQKHQSIIKAFQHYIVRFQSCGVALCEEQNNIIHK